MSKNRQKILNLDLGQRSYDIHIGPDLLSQSGELIKNVIKGRQVVIITDTIVAPYYLEKLQVSLVHSGLSVKSQIIPSGEMSKSFSILEKILEDLLADGCERETCLIALGGGVVGDITGFAASIALRGIPFIQIPTTLLSQVDSAVGGKTGINSRFGKNLIGSFYQPKLVIADTTVLETLSHRQKCSGYAEIVKYGLINDKDFFAWLELNGQELLMGNEDIKTYAIYHSCLSKAKIVAQDEYEIGTRALLNLGHTFAHALEAETGYGDRLYHGEAVSIGMTLAFDLSVRLGLCPRNDYLRLVSHLKKMSLPVSFPETCLKGEWQSQSIIDHFMKDKKVKDGKIGFILARSIGSAFQNREVPLEIVRRVIDDAILNRTSEN
jgi:3-dehydroquinate synthase